MRKKWWFTLELSVFMRTRFSSLAIFYLCLSLHVSSSFSSFSVLLIHFSSYFVFRCFILALRPSFLHVCDRKDASDDEKVVKTVKKMMTKKHNENWKWQKRQTRTKKQETKNLHNERANNNLFGRWSKTSHNMYRIVTYKRDGPAQGHGHNRQTHTDRPRSPRFSWVSSFSLFSSLSGEWMYLGNNNKVKINYRYHNRHAFGPDG